ncbi:Ppx/GppA family phosphatase [Nocardioides guangzhouensis]|uniref:Ppx/GppA family phosphatase n=1 Tax=Nocardioides guangzhouensis TaxID=2497878 RepID=A0A4Q4ZAM4_9ACTN|nr:Ppx/GppA family phosphatase [Nocardioides guangzhouensis]RYP84154.1 Ppx/GppA family phosphatase [Nocardioides guangzhouensis]
MTEQPTIVPRWEWRTFGDLGPARDRVGSLVTDEAQASEELYLLSAYGDASVKVRGGLMDVKTLDTVRDDGLELWIPRMKTVFPLTAGQAGSVLAALGVEPPPGAGEWTQDRLVIDVIRADPRLRAPTVRKWRRRGIVDGCMVELTEITVDGASATTVVVEASDPGLVTSTVHRLGLDDRRNTCFARGLKSLLRWGRFAVVDVGTNSVKFHLGECLGDGGTHTLMDRSEVTRLGEGLAETGGLTGPALARTADAIAGMVDEARRHAAVEIAAVGTAGMRQAPNRADLVDTVRARCGVTIEVIPGEEEARLAYVAATASLPVAGGRLVVFDSGGGSSQFTFGEVGRIDEQFSVDVGAVRFAERYGLTGAVPRETVDEAGAAITADLDRLAGRETPDAVVAIGGTATNLAAVRHGLAAYDPDVVHGTALDLAEIDRQIELYRTRDAEERRAIVGLQPARAEVILAGACIARAILTLLGRESLTVSDRGLRHGVFAERFDG